MVEPPARQATDSEISFGGLEHYRLDDYRRLILRRKWLIALVTFSLALGIAVVSAVLPNIYKATTTILVDSQRVPESYVKSTVSTTVVDRLATIREQILSATRLAQVIDEMHLYPQLRGREPEEEIIARIQKDIDIRVENLGRDDGGLGAFSIAFHSQDPVQAARVTNRLASLFIEENIKARDQQVLGTTSFIDKELSDAKKNMDQQEGRIRELKTQYVSVLPESENTHVQAISSLQLEMQAEMDSIDRAQQQKVLLQAQLEETPRVVNLDSSVSPEVTALQVLRQQEQAQLGVLRRRYGPDFPDVVKRTLQVQEVDKAIAAAEKSYAAAKTSAPKASHPAGPVNPVLASEIAQLDQEIQKHNQRIEEIKQEIDLHQAKLEKIPLFQQQMDSVMRDYDVARDEYMRLLSLKFNADMSADLEMRQKGERFEILDAAEVPVIPDSPDRPLIDLIGLGVGLVCGLGLAIGLELIDPTVKTEREIISALGSSIFAEVPWLETKRDKRHRRWRAIVAGATSTLVAAVYCFILIWSWRGALPALSHWRWR